MLASIVFLLLAFLEPISCWGGLGHRTVAYLAEKYFTDGAVHFVNDLLENDQGFDISDAALFADKIRHRRPWTAQWHFIGVFTHMMIEGTIPNRCFRRKG